VEKLGSVKFYIEEGVKNPIERTEFGGYRRTVIGSLNESQHTLMTTLVSSVITVAVDSN
jgi:hypothetical protein